MAEKSAAHLQTRVRNRDEKQTVEIMRRYRSTGAAMLATLPMSAEPIIQRGEYLNRTLAGGSISSHYLDGLFLVAIAHTVSANARRDFSANAV